MTMESSLRKVGSRLFIRHSLPLMRLLIKGVTTLMGIEVIIMGAKVVINYTNNKGRSKNNRNNKYDEQPY